MTGRTFSEALGLEPFEPTFTRTELLEARDMTIPYRHPITGKPVGRAEYVRATREQNRSAVVAELSAFAAAGAADSPADVPSIDDPAADADDANEGDETE